MIDRRSLLTAAFGLLISANAGAAQPLTGIATYGEPKYPSNFDHFDYVDVNAPKGGEVRLYDLNTFDSLNPFIIKGRPPTARGLTPAPVDLIGITIDTLLAGSADEPASAYGLIAESLEVPPDRSWVIFNLRKEARFHDGSPITADDVLFSFDILRTKGAPAYRAFLHNVVSAEKLADRKVRFTFAPGDNRQLPLVLGGLPILSKAYWQGRAFDQTTLDPPLGSGPYKVESFEAGRYMTLVRVPDYWGKDLPVNKGTANFDRVRTDYYRDSTAALEAFKAGDYDIRPEFESKKWATAYDFPAVREGKVKKRNFSNQRTESMQGFVYNLRRPLWQDRAVRRALAYAFDFEWTNKNLFYGLYARTTSYFANSELGSSGLPSPDELKLFEPLRGQIPDEVFTQPYSLPVTDGKGDIRDNLRIAARMLKEAGWTVKDGKLVKDNQPFSFEILVDDPVWERICLPFIENLKRLGIEAHLRVVDSAQYRNRLNDFDFDMIVVHWSGSDSPGEDLRALWSSTTADLPGSLNLAGVKSPAIDALVDKVIASTDRKTLVTRVHALDRVLLWGNYVIPQWHQTGDHVAYWDKFGMPATIPYQGAQLFTWWLDPAKAGQTPPAKKQ
jgi:microcin C transport system substrate-binding protein